MAQFGSRVVCTAVDQGNSVKITFWDPPRVATGGEMGKEMRYIFLSISLLSGEVM